MHTSNKQFILGNGTSDKHSYYFYGLFFHFNGLFSILIVFFHYCSFFSKFFYSNAYDFFPSNVTLTQQNTPQYSTIQHNTIQHNKTHHNTAQYNITQHNTTQYYTIQCNTVQHNTTQHNTTQHNITQHITTEHNVTQCVSYNTNITTTAETLITMEISLLQFMPTLLDC